MIKRDRERRLTECTGTTNSANKTTSLDVNALTATLREEMKKIIQDEITVILKDNTTLRMITTEQTNEITALKEEITKLSAIITKTQADIADISPLKQEMFQLKEVIKEQKLSSPINPEEIQRKVDNSNVWGEHSKTLLQTSLKEIMEEESREQKEKERKKNNLIIFNIVESESSSVNDKKHHDLERQSNLCSYLSETPKTEKLSKAR